MGDDRWGGLVSVPSAEPTRLGIITTWTVTQTTDRPSGNSRSPDSRFSRSGFSGQIYLIAYGDHAARFPVEAPRTQIALGGDFTFRNADDAELQLSATNPWETLVPLLALRHHRVANATTDELGALRVTFDNDSTLFVGPHARYENWQLSGPGSLILVAPPGGGDPRIAGSTEL
jgi:hypothetical protein